MENRASLTAQGIAIMRAIESEKPEAERLFFDPYARRFVNPWLLAMSKFFTRTGYAERRGPGVQGYLVARTRYIDDTLLSGLEKGMQQVVILGAGYDARAYRFAAAIEGKARVFEVDHPATQPVKIEKLRQLFGRLPEQVTYVPVDFDRAALADGLVSGGYDQSLRTLFIWEGVTMYLTPEAVDATLAFIAHRSGPGSELVFDYVYRSVIEGAVRRGEAAGMRRYRRFTGEGLVFGIPQGTVEQFLASRGFCRIHDATAQELERLYFSEGPQRGRQVAPVYAIASAATGDS